MTDLSQFEIALLREMNGEPMGLAWGAATGEALEFLVNSGHIERNTTNGVYHYLLTDKGVNFLEEFYRSLQSG